jgi:hypothetical protein
VVLAAVARLYAVWSMDDAPDAPGTLADLLLGGVPPTPREDYHPLEDYDGLNAFAPVARALEARIAACVGRDERASEDERAYLTLGWSGSDWHGATLDAVLDRQGVAGPRKPRATPRASDQGTTHGPSRGAARSAAVAAAREQVRVAKRARQDTLASATPSPETRPTKRSSTRTTSALPGSGLSICLEADRCYIHKLWRTARDGGRARVATRLSMPIEALDCLMAARYVLRRYEVDALGRASDCPRLDSVDAAGAAYDEMVEQQTPGHFSAQGRRPWRRGAPRAAAAWRAARERLGRLHEELAALVTVGKLPAVDAWRDGPGGPDAALRGFVARWGLAFAVGFYGPAAAALATPDCWRADARGSRTVFEDIRPL